MNTKLGPDGMVAEAEGAFVGAAVAVAEAVGVELVVGSGVAVGVALGPGVGSGVVSWRLSMHSCAPSWVVTDRTM
jgi:hypothetical protein